MSKGKLFGYLKRATSISLVVCMLCSALVGIDIYYNSGSEAFAAELVGTSNGTSGDQTIKGAQNLGTLDNSTGTTYWYAGNAFYGMNRNGIEFGEDYDTSDWLLVDTDAMWGGEYLFSTWGSAYRADGSDLYTVSEDAATGGVADVNKVYYQKILTYGERLWSQYGSTWFTGKEASAVGTATVTTTNNSYRTFEDYVGGASSVGTYNYWIGATTADNIAANNYSISHVKKWYETGSTDTTKYGTLNEAQTATTIENSVDDYINTSTYNGITEDELGVKSSNIYSIIGAHLYAPSVTELQANETVYKQIIKNVYADYTAETNETGNWGPNGGWFSAAKSTATANPAGHLWDRTRTVLWSRSFSGLRVHNSYFFAWIVHVHGDLSSYDNLSSSSAVAPAFNLDTSSVVMARSAQASVTPSSELASYNPNNLGANVEFSLQSDKLSLTTAIAGQKLNNVVAGQSYDIAYSGASLSGEASPASAKYYVSAAIYDENDKIVYYGQLAQVAANGSGTVTLTIPETLEAGKEYKLALFEEQLNGTYNVSTPSGKSITTYTTDYVSAMNVATFTLDSLTATVNEGASLKEETTYTAEEIANLITVTSAASGELEFGTAYTIKSVVNGDATVEGSSITTGDNGSKNAKEITFEIAYVDGNMNIVPSTTVTLTVNSSDSVADDTYQGDQESEADENGFYTWKDETSNITWKYKTNDVGEVTYLYTSEDPSPLIDAAGTLNIPSRIAGLTVIGIGGGTENTPVVSMGDGDWTNLSIPTTVTTINDYAFAKANQQKANIIIPSTISKIGAKAFYKSKIASLKINEMNGTIGYLAFGSCSNLSKVIIKGDGLTIEEEAFSSSGITTLSISGDVTIEKNAFKKAAGITSLYLPNSVVAEEYAFNECSGITTLETDMTTLKNNSFAGCNAIKTLIIDDNVETVEYDWNGHTATVDRTIYEKGVTKFQFYAKDSTYYSAYGTSGNVRVVYDEGSDEGTDLVPSNNILTATTKTLANHTNKYQTYYTGQAASVTYVYDGAKTTEQIMAEDAANDVNVKSDIQTGIEVSFDGTLLTTQAIDKSKVNVVSLFGDNEGLHYDPEHFYVIRTEEFNSLSRNNAVTEEAVAAFEPLTAQNSDLQNGLSAAIVVFTTVSENEGNTYYTEIENDGYFYATVSVRVEEYSDQDYVEEKYGSYTDIVEEINGLNGDIASMEESMKDIITNINTALGTSYDVNAEDLVSEYEKAVEALSDALSSSVSENAGNIAEVKALINSVNTTYGSNITLDDDATTEEINNAITEALQVISDDQTSKNETITALKAQYVEIAQMLSNYMENTENMEADAVDGTTIADIKAAISTALSDLNKAKSELSDIDSALDKLYEALNDAMTNMQSIMTTDDLESDESAADKIESITSMVQMLSASYEANNEYLRSCIAEIDLAFGYGNYVKYNDKYVFYIFENDVYYIKGTDARTYLTTTDSGATFTPAENQEELATAYDGKDGVKFFYLSDTVNGWQPYQNNPLNDYKKAMQALINGFNGVSENTATLIETVNTICGLESGDDGYVSIPENASTTQINAAMETALTTVNGKLLSLDAQNQEFAEQYLEAAKALNEFMENDYEDAIASENAAEVTAAVKAALAELTSLRGEMSDINNALNNLYLALDKAFSDMGLGGVASTTGDGDESVADKLESIGGMIEIITNNYNQLNEQYDNLEGEYQTILDYVYGEDEKTVDQVTAEEVAAQIEKNKKEAIDAAVAEALKNAEDLNSDAETIQKELAEIIDVIMEGEDVATEGMSVELATSLGKVQEMQANVSAMQSAVEGYESVLSTIQSALGLDSTATSAEIIAAIQGLKDQVAELSAKVTQLEADKVALESQLAENGTYKAGYEKGYADGVASVDTSTNSDTYKIGYNAGYTDGYDDGHGAGYNEGLLANSGTGNGNGTDNSEQIATLTAQVTALTKENKELTEEVKALTATKEKLEADVTELDKSVTSLTKENTDLKSSVSTLNTSVDTLTKENSDLKAEVTTLAKSVDTLTKENTDLEAEVTALDKSVDSLTKENTDLKADVKDLNKSVTSLTKENTELKSSVSTLNTSVDSLEKENTSLETEVSTLTSKTTELNNTISTLTTSNTNLKSQITSLKQQIENLKDAANDDSSSSETVEESETEEENSENTETPSPAPTLQSGTQGSYTITQVPTLTSTDNRATVTLLDDTADVSSIVKAKEGTVTASSVTQMGNANAIFEYYANNIGELGVRSGVKSLKNAESNKNATIDISALVSFELAPTAEQEKSIKNGKGVALEVTFDGIENGSLYLVVHESAARGEFDILLVEAEDDYLSFMLEDLSPISIAKVNIGQTLDVEVDADKDDENAEGDVPAGTTPDTDETEGDSASAVLVMIIFFAAIVVGFIALKKKGYDPFEGVKELFNKK